LDGGTGAVLQLLLQGLQLGSTLLLLGPLMRLLLVLLLVRQQQMRPRVA
jgi:hypothetical protein